MMHGNGVYPLSHESRGLGVVNVIFVNPARVLVRDRIFSDGPSRSGGSRVVHGSTVRTMATVDSLPDQIGLLTHNFIPVLKLAAIIGCWFFAP